MTENFRLERAGQPDLVFDGELIADVSSRELTQRRWTEIRIYATATGKYVSEIAGITLIRGEKNRRVVKVAESPEELRQALMRKPRRGSDGKPFLTHLAMDAIAKAAEKRPELRDLLDEHI